MTLRAVKRAMLPGAVTLGAYGVVVAILFETRVIDPSALLVCWTGSWLLGAVFAGRNVHASYREWRAVVRRGRPVSEQIGGRWLFRQALFGQCTSLCMALAGTASLLGALRVEGRAAVFLLAGAVYVVSQMLDWVDRDVLERAVAAEQMGKNGEAEEKV